MSFISYILSCFDAIINLIGLIIKSLILLKGIKLKNCLYSRLCVWRKYLGLTQQKFADMVGLNISVLRKYESGTNTPGGDALIAICKTGVNAQWLLMGIGEMVASQQVFDAANTPMADNDEQPIVEVDSSYAKRLFALRGLLDGIEPDKRAKVMDELFYRVQEAKRVSELEKIIQEMRAKLG